MSPYYKIGRMAVWSLVLLRLGVGWHFFMEGQTKVKEGDFSSKGFLSAAKGPLAPLYKQAIWDSSGEVRLNKDEMTKLFQELGKKATDEYKFTSEQSKQAEEITKLGIEKLDEVYSEWEEDIYKFGEGTTRVESMAKDPMRQFVSSMREQKDKIESDRLASVRPALSTIDKIIASQENELNELATKEQRAVTAPVSLPKPGALPLQSDMVDKIIPIFDMVIGILLIVGLLTRVASLAAAGFLLSVVLSQFPGFPGTQPTYFQAVEVLACLVLFGTDAGRFAGLDFIPWSIWQFASAPKKATAKT
jgi:uncharacterized membrane protein YphA (DoxX/SURF4 family)